MKTFILLVLLFWATDAQAMTLVTANKIVDAIYKAEGGAKAKKPYGILSVSCNTKEECRRICLNTVRNNFKRWERAGRKVTYLEFLASRYAPVSAHPLNKNWLKNVKELAKMDEQEMEILESAYEVRS